MSYIDPVFPMILIVAVVSLVRVWRHSNYRPWLLSLSIAAVVIISVPILASVLAKPLESRYDRLRVTDTGEAIVVLSGACETADLQQRFPPLAADSYSRSFYAAWLYRSQPPRPVLVTGAKCAFPMAHFLELEGVPRSLILQEDQALNTHENALFSSRILHSKGIRIITLVTDEKSMLRAELCFRKEGVDVIPYPLDLGTGKFDVLALLPTWQAIRANSLTTHEALGLLWYKHKGYV